MGSAGVIEPQIKHWLSGSFAPPGGVLGYADESQQWLILWSELGVYLFGEEAHVNGVEKALGLFNRALGREVGRIPFLSSGAVVNHDVDISFQLFENTLSRCSSSFETN